MQIKIEIESLWQNYERKVMCGVNPTSVQYVETKRAFYAGVFETLRATALLGDENVSEQDGARALDDLFSQTVAFFKAESLRSMGDTKRHEGH